MESNVKCIFIYLCNSICIFVGKCVVTYPNKMIFFFTFSSQPLFVLIVFIVGLRSMHILRKQFWISIKIILISRNYPMNVTRNYPMHVSSN